ncbi:uncharacterized protein LOC119666085 [Teleopsis dalmanni]|uniref:uncharacterized protein LOC119666085 n=1 Tax=Teleopsis dalmanni TaxID=139649 RepID=UPI0018CCD2A2|nr:uncharacterized protein LOC119666085 [Teleopsis dalmanni]
MSLRSLLFSESAKSWIRRFFIASYLSCAGGDPIMSATFRSLEPSNEPITILKELKLVKESNIDVIAKFHTLMNMMEKRSDTAVSDNCFPIKTFEELGNMDALCATKSAQYAKLIKSIIQPEGIKKNLHRIIDRTLVLELNYDEIGTKKAFKEFKFLNASIFEALQKDGYTEKEYISDIRIAIKNVKGIHYKQQCNDRKKRRVEETSK